MKLRTTVSAFMLTAAFISASSQGLAIKTNLLYDASATINLGVEMPLKTKWTLDISGNLNAWNINGHRWRHWLLQPEARYWLCESFQGHFFGAHTLGGQYNVGNINNSIKFLGTDFSSLSHNRHQGWMAGVGIAYGYSWIVSKHWNMEAEFGFGWVYTRYDVFPCSQCGNKISDDKVHNYVGPTKLAINLEYIF